MKKLNASPLIKEAMVHTVKTVQYDFEIKKIEALMKDISDEINSKSKKTKHELSLLKQCWSALQNLKGLYEVSRFLSAELTEELMHRSDLYTLNTATGKIQSAQKSKSNKKNGAKNAIN